MTLNELLAATCIEVYRVNYLGRLYYSDKIKDAIAYVNDQIKAKKVLGITAEFYAGDPIVEIVVSC